MPNSMSQLWLAIRCSDLVLRAVAKPIAMEGACIVVDKQRVVFTNQRALALGVRYGMDTTTAQLLAECEIFHRNPAIEKEILSRLCDDMYQFTPHIDTYISQERPESGLLLEIGSCLRLFNGVHCLVKKIEKFLEGKASVFSMALAPSAKAAWILSYDDNKAFHGNFYAHSVSRIKRLPITLLYDYPNEISALKKMGFDTFSDIAQKLNSHSKFEFRKRIGNSLTQILCEVLEVEILDKQKCLFETPRPNYHPKQFFCENIQFDFPVRSVEYLRPAFESLLGRLSEYLRKHQKQSQNIEWILSDIYGNKKVVSIFSDQEQVAWKLFFDLTVIKFEKFELNFEIDILSLECCSMTNIVNRDSEFVFNLNADSCSEDNAYLNTLSKLKARLGEEAVYKIHYSDNRLPELTNAIISLNEKCKHDLPGVHKHSLRPTWLLQTPERISQNDGKLYWQGLLAVLSGPERIVGEWWHAPSARDYYLAKRQDHTPIWVYFDLYQKQWYVHGIFA